MSASSTHAVTRPFCASSPEAAELSDEEFWEHVWPHPTEEEEAEALLDDIQRETWVIECARCCRFVEVDESERADRERDAFCDDCAAEHVADDEGSVVQ